jgi:pyruvate/2-oxoglutarate dehydrogenase complex dihydrolipoamide dehydrogenase (E3) component
MAAPKVWVAKDDGSDLVRAEAIAAVGRDYTGTVTARLWSGEGSAVTLVTVVPHEGKHTPDDFHRQLVRVVAQLADAAQATVVSPVWDDHGWRWATEPL